MTQVPAHQGQGLNGEHSEDMIDSAWIDFFENGEVHGRIVEEGKTIKNKRSNTFEFQEEVANHHEDNAEQRSVSPMEDISNGNLNEGAVREDKIGNPHQHDFEKEDISKENADKTVTEQVDAAVVKKSKKRGRAKQRAPRPNPSGTHSLSLNTQTSHTRDNAHSSRERKITDSMSDQGHVHHRTGRKLLRGRGQLRKFHSMEAGINHAGPDILEQKLQELQELLASPLPIPDPRKLRLSQKQLQKMVKLGQMHEDLGQKGERSRSSTNPWLNSRVQRGVVQDNKAYSTIRILQTAGPSHQVSNSYHHHHHPESKTHHHPSQNDNNQRRTSADHSSDYASDLNEESTHRGRLITKPPRPSRHHRKDSVESSPTSSSGASHQQGEKSEYSQTESHEDSDCSHDSLTSEGEDGESRSKISNTSPHHIYVPGVDMHLKYSNNPELKDWLKHKDMEYRKQKKAERAKKREERQQKFLEEQLKHIRREKSAERVKEWMEAKRKEAVKQKKEERQRQKRLTAQESAQRASRTSENGISGQHIERPASALAPAKNHTPIKRPESSLVKRPESGSVKLDVGDGTAPKPPESKFVYKRPVTGRVRLMKLQKERSELARSTDKECLQELSPEEKEKKQRLSYDAWLIAKRKDDMQKRKAAEKQKELMKSDPEMERIVPEIAQKRIEKIMAGKKSIDTGIKQIDSKVNKAFGGGAFGQGSQAVEEKQSVSVPSPSSYKLSIEGSSATLVELTSRARPVSAKSHMPIPQSAFSPRRPKSAKPKVNAVIERNFSAEPNPFKLPFPEEQGVPEHVKHVQAKLFAQTATSTRQGSAQPQPVSGFPRGEEAVQKTTSPHSSLVLLQQIESEMSRQGREVLDKGREALDAPLVKQSWKKTEDTTRFAKDSDKQTDTPHSVRDKTEGVEVEVGIRPHHNTRIAAASNKLTKSAKSAVTAETANSDDVKAAKNLQVATTSVAEVKEDLTVANKDHERFAAEEMNSTQISPDDSSDEDVEIEELLESEEEDSTRKSSSKHVSFSEEATVYKVEEESVGADSSLDFENENGNHLKSDNPYEPLDDELF